MTTRERPLRGAAAALQRTLPYYLVEAKEKIKSCRSGSTPTWRFLRQYNNNDNRIWRIISSWPGQWVPSDIRPLLLIQLPSFFFFLSFLLRTTTTGGKVAEKPGALVEVAFARGNGAIVFTQCYFKIGPSTSPVNLIEFTQIIPMHIQ